MPTYDYVCDGCKHTFEKFHSMKDEPIKKCPQCGKLKVRRLLGMGGGIIFKGTGFYQTDYKSSGSKSEPAQKSSDKDSSCKGEPKSCQKPDCGGK